MRSNVVRPEQVVSSAQSVRQDLADESSPSSANCGLNAHSLLATLQVSPELVTRIQRAQAIAATAEAFFEHPSAFQTSDQARIREHILCVIANALGDVEVDDATASSIDRWADRLSKAAARTGREFVDGLDGHTQRLRSAFAVSNGLEVAYSPLELVVRGPKAVLQDLFFQSSSTVGQASAGYILVADDVVSEAAKVIQRHEELHRLFAVVADPPNPQSFLSIRRAESAADACIKLTEAVNWQLRKAWDEIVAYRFTGRETITQLENLDVSDFRVEAVKALNSNPHLSAAEKSMVLGFARICQADASALLKDYLLTVDMLLDRSASDEQYLALGLVLQFPPHDLHKFQALLGISDSEFIAYTQGRVAQLKQALTDGLCAFRDTFSEPMTVNADAIIARLKARHSLGNTLQQIASIGHGALWTEGLAALHAVIGFDRSIACSYLESGSLELGHNLNGQSVYLSLIDYCLGVLGPSAPERLKTFKANVSNGTIVGSYEFEAGLTLEARFARARKDGLSCDAALTKTLTCITEGSVEELTRLFAIDELRYSVRDLSNTSLLALLAKSRQLSGAVDPAVNAESRRRNNIEALRGLNHGGRQLGSGVKVGGETDSEGERVRRDTRNCLFDLGRVADILVERLERQGVQSIAEAEAIVAAAKSCKQSPPEANFANTILPDYQRFEAQRLHLERVARGIQVAHVIASTISYTDKHLKLGQIAEDPDAIRAIESVGVYMGWSLERAAIPKLHWSTIEELRPIRDPSATRTHHERILALASVVAGSHHVSANSISFEERDFFVRQLAILLHNLPDDRFDYRAVCNIVSYENLAGAGSATDWGAIRDSTTDGSVHFWASVYANRQT
ncbi:MAG: hypothetical protein K1X79_07985 [Oligoflexia bacterium]|nr:hypothetical protein [Oligoflexia bacterium]